MFSVAFMFKGKDRSIHTWGRGNSIRGLGPNCKKWRLVLEDCPIVKHGDCVSDLKKKEKRPFPLSLSSSLLGQIAFSPMQFSRSRRSRFCSNDSGIKGFVLRSKGWNALLSSLRSCFSCAEIAPPSRRRSGIPASAHYPPSPWSPSRCSCCPYTPSGARTASPSCQTAAPAPSASGWKSAGNRTLYFHN